MKTPKNLVVVEGRLTAKPEFKKTKCGKSTCVFTLSNNRYYFQGKSLIDEVSYFKVVAYGPLGDRCATLAKGSLILVSGTLKMKEVDSIAGRANEVCIVASNVKFISQKKAS